VRRSRRDVRVGIKKVRGRSMEKEWVFRISDWSLVIRKGGVMVRMIIKSLLEDY
jgi:hypothetical protein